MYVGMCIYKYKNIFLSDKQRVSRDFIPQDICFVKKGTVHGPYSQEGSSVTS